MRLSAIVIAVWLGASPLFAGETGNARIGFAGDTFLGSWAAEFLDSAGVAYPFAAVDSLFHQMDIVVANLESPITTSSTPYIEKTWLLKSPPGIGRGLYNANIRAVTIANNHILDYGPAGLRDTFHDLDAAAVQHFGAGKNKAEALKEASFTIHGQRIALLGFSATFPEEFWASDTSAGTAFPYRDDVIRRVDDCAARYDIVVCIFHWGEEKRETPKDYQIELGHLCIDHGADIVVGHHPHVVQGIEFYKNAPIFYSVGNFAFASYSEDAKVGLIADITFTNGRVYEVRAIPVKVYNAEVNMRPVPLKGTDRDVFFAHLREITAAIGTASPAILDDGRIVK